VPAGTADWNYSTAAVYTYSLPSPRPAPTQPSTDRSQYSAGSNVTVSWAASSGSTSYYINVDRVDPSGNSLSYLHQRCTGTSYTLTSLPAGSYSVNVQACSDVWSSDPLWCYFTVTNETYTVLYRANGGTGAPSSQTKYAGEDLTLSSTQPTRDNYQFLGWSECSTAKSPTYSAGGI
jgi:hypothetical protein